MNFSVTLDGADGMTITRLIGRIVQTDTPGELRLHDGASGSKATVAIHHRMNDPAPFLHTKGVPSLCLHTGSDICWRRLPVSYSSVQAALHTYAGGERTLTPACLASGPL